ncbi:MAG: DUF1501 domain-containing protein [Planctomycetia bacterium]|nr:DUF1501 domain-containing protein [Planctomycetia bacterium]
MLLPSRRTFLSDIGMGFSGLALSAMLHRDGYGKDGSSPALNFPAKAKRVIWLFMVGGTSHMESFDPKPMLNKYDGKTIAETPYKDLLNSPHLKTNLRELLPGQHKVQPKVYRMQVDHKKWGMSGLDISNWWPHVAAHADKLAIVRSLWTTDNDHGAQLQFHTGRHVLEGPHPTIGSWAHYGLGSLNENLPSFVVLGTPLADCCGGVHGHGSHYLGPEHNGIRLKVDPKNPLPFAVSSMPKSAMEQAAEFELAGKLNALSNVTYPDDPALRARIKSYELAYKMQSSVPEVVNFASESEATRKLYGLDNAKTKPFGEQCLAARRLVERGVRFVQVFHGSNGGAGAWDAHGGLKSNHTELCAQVDQPIGALLTDLDQRGLLDETIVVWGSEFGRTPGAEKSDGRDHHPYGFSAWMCGGGIKGGIAHGATDELGFHAVEHRHYVTDLHATVLHQLGLDSRKLEIPGRKRLEIDFGEVIREVIG